MAATSNPDTGSMATPIPPGTIGLVHTGGLAGWIIREDTQDRWNHIVLSGLDCLYEADPRRGYIRSPLHTYGWGDIVWLIHEPLTDGQRLRRVDAAIERIGLPYNWPAIAAIALKCFEIRFRWLDRWATNRKHLMCSEAVAEIARESGTAWFPPTTLTSSITPGDIDYNFRLRGI